MKKKKSFNYINFSFTLILDLRISVKILLEQIPIRVNIFMESQILYLKGSFFSNVSISERIKILCFVAVIN